MGVVGFVFACPYLHACMYAHTHTHTQYHTHTLSHAHTITHSLTHSLTHAHTITHYHTQTHTITHTRAPGHTYAFLLILVSLPQIIMIQKMSKDMKVFFALLVLLRISYGICAQVLLEPNVALSQQSIVNIFYR